VALAQFVARFHKNEKVITEQTELMSSIIQSEHSLDDMGQPRGRQSAVTYKSELFLLSSQ
jgi:hypothetical protein